MAAIMNDPAISTTCELLNASMLERLTVVAILDVFLIVSILIGS